MWSATTTLLRHANFKERLKTRMVGYVPTFVPRKSKNSLCALRSEANTGYYIGIMKAEADRLDTTGRKVQAVNIDPCLNRYVVFKEAKIKNGMMTKSHIQKPAPLPWLVQAAAGPTKA